VLVLLIVLVAGCVVDREGLAPSMGGVEVPGMERADKGHSSTGATTTTNAPGLPTTAAAPFVDAAVPMIEAGMPDSMYVEPAPCADGTCGGSCEPCDAAVEAGCVPSCAGRACGDDGCGGVCGACGADAECHDGLCVAVVPIPPEDPEATQAQTCWGEDRCFDCGEEGQLCCSRTQVGYRCRGDDLDCTFGVCLD
jgi:hypothetical protein